MKRAARLIVQAGLFGVLFAGQAPAQDNCALCAKEIVFNSALATCFLQDFPQLAGGDSRAVAIDLSACVSRGVIEPLPAPNVGSQEPDTKFMLSRSQLNCLKTKLEDPNLVLDPSAKIELSSC